MQAQHIGFLDLLDGQVQYAVPRWQRRYRWGQADIERLVEDLLTVSVAGSDAMHYGGTLLTFPEPGPAGVVKTIRVVDGQQRLTTVSILLACIADELGSEGRCGEWTAQVIRDDRLTNPRKPEAKFRKLRLQNGDEEEYRLGLEGDSNPAGAGAVAQAWRIMRRLVARNDTASLLQGLERLRVVSIGLDRHEDPQQIFESLNATGRPLTESEKVKNWLLMGLPDAEQQDLHDNHWLRIEKCLGARHSTDPTDIFLRDVLRWWTGETQGMNRVYEGFRRWAVRSREAGDRPALCRDLTRLAGLYGKITGAAGAHPDAKVERELRHLRAMGIDVHRPLTLRLLHDASKNDRTRNGHATLARTLAGIGAWVTRMWLADRPTAGLNKAAAELAHEAGPAEGADVAEHWLERIRRLRNTRAGVPRDEDVREGIRTRKAYRGSATRSTFAILCELMEAEHGKEAPARDYLTVEHVMPQKLTDEWKRALGDDAEEIHGRYRDRLANLTLSGWNSELGAKPFEEKRKLYSKSLIGMTRIIAEESAWGESAWGEAAWDEAALERRAEYLAGKALDRWPWRDQRAPEGKDPSHSAKLRWRIEDSPWNNEEVASRMVLNVAAALLSQDPANAQRLSGEAVGSSVHSAGRYPPGVRVGALMMRAIPGHEDYVLYPYGHDATNARRCQKMGERCGVTVEVEFEENNRPRAFWKCLKKHAGGIPGQKDSWKGETQRSSRLNASGDCVGIHIGNAELVWLYIRAGEDRVSDARTARMTTYSGMICDRMGDQQLGENIHGNSVDGRSIAVQRSWVRDDEDDWPDAAQWIREQFDRLYEILATAPDEAGERR